MSLAGKMWHKRPARLNKSKFTTAGHSLITRFSFQNHSFVYIAEFGCGFKRFKLHACHTIFEVERNVFSCCNQFNLTTNFINSARLGNSFVQLIDYCTEYKEKNLIFLINQNVPFDFPINI